MEWKIRRSVSAVSTCPLTHRTGITNALAEVLVGWVIGEPSKLILNGFRKRRVRNDGILSFLVREVGVEIGNIQNGFLHIH